MPCEILITPRALQVMFSSAYDFSVRFFLENPMADVPAVPRAYTLGPRVRKAIEALASGECRTIKDAAVMAGLARESLGRALQKPHVIEHMEKRVRYHNRLNALAAPATIRSVMNSNNHAARLKAASYSQAVAFNIQPPQTSAPNVNVIGDLNVGYVIDLSGNGNTAPTPPTIEGEIIESEPVPKTIKP
jgi:hypothetical protein